jgi:multisubunit Na+/H+ antiporter MnhE subunit
MTAIVTALIALLFQGSLPPLNIAAAIFAVMGLRQIRRQPERYIGRALCWIAIALVLILAILNAMLQPPVPGDAPVTVPEPGAVQEQ